MGHAAIVAEVNTEPAATASSDQVRRTELVLQRYKHRLPEAVSAICHWIVSSRGYHNSGFFYSAQNEDFTKENPYTVVGARLSYLYEPSKIRVTAYGKNLTNQHYNIARFPTDFGTSDSRARPRSFGLRINWDY